MSKSQIKLEMLKIQKEQEEMMNRMNAMIGNTELVLNLYKEEMKKAD